MPATSASLAYGPNAIARQAGRGRPPQQAPLPNRA